MTRHEIAVLACKILALWMLAQAVVFFPTVILMIVAAVAGIAPGGFNWTDFSVAAASGFPAVCMLSTAIVLWQFAPSIASRMVSASPEPVTGLSINQESVLAIAFAAVGVTMLIPALRDVSSIVVGIVRGNHPFGDYWISSQWQARFWSALLGLGLSIWLIFGSLGVARIVLKLRRPDGEVEADAAGGFPVVQRDATDAAGGDPS